MKHEVILGRSADEDRMKPLRVGIPVHRRDGSLRSMAEVQDDLIQYALRFHENQTAPAARSLGIGRSTLYRLDHQVTGRPVRIYRSRTKP